MINQYIKFLYIPIIITLVIVLIVFFVKLAGLMKKVVGVNDSVGKMNNDLNKINESKKQIEDTKNSWRFFISIFIIITILKEVFEDYHDTKKDKRQLSKSFKKTCVKNIGKIKKIKI